MTGDIFGIVNAKAVASYFQASNIADGSEYLGYMLFPMKRVAGMDLSFIKGKNAGPVLARPVAYDAEAGVVSRTPFNKLSSEMPKFAESLVLSEKEQIKLNGALAAANSGNDPLLRGALESYFDDRTNLISRLIARPNQLAMSLISTGKITINTDTNEAIEIDYTDAAWKASNKKESTVAWSSLTTSKPLTDIEGVIEDAADEGVTLATLVMNRDTWKNLVRSTEVKNRYNPNGAFAVNDNGYQSFIEQDLGVAIIVENRTYALTDGGTKHKFYPDGVVSFLPEGNLGSMCFGTTAEELAASNGGTQYAVTGEGIGLSVYQEGHPARIVTTAAEVVLPSCEKIDSIYILDVTHTA